MNSGLGEIVEKFLRSVVETKKELCRLGIKDDSEAELTTNWP